jgi:hypothetical protein
MLSIYEGVFGPHSADIMSLPPAIASVPCSIALPLRPFLESGLVELRGTSLGGVAERLDFDFEDPVEEEAVHNRWRALIPQLKCFGMLPLKFSVWVDVPYQRRGEIPERVQHLFTALAPCTSSGWIARKLDEFIEGEPTHPFLAFQFHEKLGPIKWADQ